MRYKFNWRYLLKYGLLAAVACTAVFYAHRWQLQKQVNFFLHRADEAREAAGKAEGAERTREQKREADFLQRYLLSQPWDSDSRERLIRLMFDSAKTGKELIAAHLALEDLLRREPERNSLRRFAIEFEMRPRVGLFPEAQNHIAFLLGKQPNDGELESLDARCLALDKKYVEAVAKFEKAIGHRPDLVDSYAALAGIQRFQLKDPVAADKVVARMLAANPKAAKTYIHLAEYWRSIGRPMQTARVVSGVLADAQYAAFHPGQKMPPDEAVRVAEAIDQVVARAREIAPDDLGVILLAADTARYRARVGGAVKAGPDEGPKHLADARALLERGIALYPSSSEVYLALAALDVADGKASDAVAVLRKGIGAIADSVDLLAGLIDVQIQAGDGAGATETLERISTLDLPNALLDLQQARILVLREEWVEAARVLARIRLEFPDASVRARQANMLLARCYEQIGDLHGRLEAYGKAVPFDSADDQWVPAYRGLAEAQAASGNTAAALEAYRRLQERTGWALIPIARLELDRVLRQREEARNWGPVEEAVSKAEAVFSKSAEVRILRAELLHLRGRSAEAIQRLEELRAEQPKDIVPRLALALLEQRGGNAEKAAATLTAAEKDIGDSPELRLARGRLWAEKKTPGAAEKLTALAVGLNTFTPAGKHKLLRGLAELAMSAGSNTVAAQFLEQIAVSYPYDLGGHLHRFDRAVETNDEGAIDRVILDVQRVDGESGVWSRLCKVLKAVWRAQKKNDPSGLSEAMNTIDVLDHERPGWGRVVLAQALIHDLQKNPHRALERYREAIRLGESNPAAIRRTAELLSDDGHWTEARDLLVKFPSAISSGANFQRMMTEINLQTKNWQGALESAVLAVPETSKDPRDQIWLGRAFWRAGKSDKAEAPFRRAVELDTEAPGGWVYLIEYLVSTNRREMAAREMEKAMAKVRTDRTFFLANGYALLGQSEKAIEAFRQARQEKPGDLRLLQAEADYLFRIGRLDECKLAFERVIALSTSSPDDKAFAKRMIAICLASNADFQTSRKALEELGLLQGENVHLPQEPGIPADVRANAFALAMQRDRPSKFKAIQLLENLQEVQLPTDKFILAQLYRAVGNKPRVRVVMSDLLRSSSEDPIYVAFFAEWLLREGDAAAAEPWVKRLAVILPDALLTTALQARLLAAQKDVVSARSLIISRAEAPGTPLGQIGLLCEELGLQEDAERFLKRFAAPSKDSPPQAILALAAYYGRQGRITDVLKVCDEARAKVAVPLVGNTAVVALYATVAKPTAEEVAKVAGWLEDAARKATPEDRALLLQQLASIRNLQGDFAASVDLYRQAFDINGRDTLAMNNLAFLLSFLEKKHDDALKLLDRAKRQIGPTPILVHTEAVVRLNKGDYEIACGLLKEIGTVGVEGPLFLHLALAEWKAGRKVEAKRAWQRAIEQGEKLTDLHPLEIPAYEKLEQLLK